MERVMNKITIADITAALVENDRVLNYKDAEIDSVIAINLRMIKDKTFLIEEIKELEKENKELKDELARNQKADR